MEEEEEEHLLKDVKEDLAEEEIPCNNEIITNEEMEDCVKFPKFTPNKIIELYRESDFQRRKLEEQKMNVQDRLLKKDDKAIVINNNQEEVDRCRKQRQEIVVKYNVAAAENVQNNSKDEKEAIKTSEEQTRMKVQQSSDENN